MCFLFGFHTAFQRSLCENITPPAFSMPLYHINRHSGCKCLERWFWQPDRLSQHCAYSVYVMELELERLPREDSPINSNCTIKKNIFFFREYLSVWLMERFKHRYPPDVIALHEHRSLKHILAATGNWKRLKSGVRKIICGDLGRGLNLKDSIKTIV